MDLFGINSLIRRIRMRRRMFGNMLRRQLRVEHNVTSLENQVAALQAEVRELRTHLTEHCLHTPHTPRPRTPFAPGSPITPPVPDPDAWWPKMPQPHPPYRWTNGTPAPITFTHTC